ncbi:o-succinylbenzoate synthase [Aquisphaera insulae]|uniref:o-succinylbenzoate synthase n=1 Tax=Aquisphaera insulae TaxID=2712864 RepID=UPI0020305692|nr:o-succinylbenzoate synthase [Aquisphaera insulae]
MIATSPIERVVLTHIQIPRKEPYGRQDDEVAIKDAVVVAVETADERAHGECSPSTSGQENLAALVEECWADLEHRIAPSLLGTSLQTVEDIATTASRWQGRSFAVAGAETALWDLLGQSHRATVAQLLGSIDEQINLGVESGFSVANYPSIVELLRTIESHLAEGYRRLKLAIRPGSDLEPIKAIRQHFGDIPLMVDANGSYSSSDLDLFRELDDLDLLMIEQPTARGDIEGLVAIQTELATPISIDESVGTSAEVEEVIRRGGCRIVNLKIQRVGGLGPARSLHDLCYQHGVACWVGSMPELGLGQAFGIHLATLANCKYPTGVQPSARWYVDDYIAPALELSSPGVFSIPRRPGVGYQVDPLKLRRYQVRQIEVTKQSIA